MKRRGIFIFHEGPDDERFIRAVLAAELGEMYSRIKTYQYSTKRPRKVCSCIIGIENIGHEYLFLTDEKPSPCVTDRIAKITAKYRDVDRSRIFVVQKEIESWYLAGLNRQAQVSLGLSITQETNSITKMDFERLMPEGFDSKIDFMQEILKLYSIPVAVRRNRSFRYLLNSLRHAEQDRRHEG